MTMVSNNGSSFPVLFLGLLFIFSKLSVCQGFQVHPGADMNTIQGNPNNRHRKPIDGRGGNEKPTKENMEWSPKKFNLDTLTRKDVFHRAFRGFCIPLVVALETVSPSSALSPDEASVDYDRYASNYDDLDGGKASEWLGIDVARSNLFRQAKGSVLEIGAGTGLNLAKYDPSKISSITLVDISDNMLQQAKKRLGTIQNLDGIPVELVKADATSQLVSRFGERSFDTVVDSFSLCVMGKEGSKKCLDQLRQVVKRKDEGGKSPILFYLLQGVEMDILNEKPLLLQVLFYY